MIPLPFTCQHEHYAAGAQDDHGNTVDGWETPATVACFWWTPSSDEPFDGSEQVGVDMSLVVDSALPVDHRDRFTVGNRVFEVVGIPKDYDHGPFGYVPSRRLVELRFMG